MSDIVESKYEVTIFGAGPAGAACAIALARAGVGRICLLEARSASASTAAAIGETIPPDSCTLLDRLGLWQAFLDEGHEPSFGSCSSWGNDALGFNDFVFNPYGCGWHLDRARFDDFLRRHALEAGVELRNGVRLVESEANSDRGYRLRVAAGARDPRVLKTHFVVDATGHGSAFARRMGARQSELDRLTFLYGFFDSTNAVSRSRLTLLEAVEKGWWYAAGLPGNRLAVAFATDSEWVCKGGHSRAARWLGAALATRHLAPRLDGCRFLADSLTVRVATSFLLDKVVERHWLAVGDAAACFDPLVAQGIHKAMTDGIDAAGHIAAALDGASTLSDSYGDRTRALFDEYLHHRNYFYGLERRWPASNFWRRRQSRTSLATATLTSGPWPSRSKID